MSRPVRISLLGQTFTLRTDETDAHIQAVAAMVDGRLRELQSQGAPGDKTLGLFAALTLADELLKCRDRATAVDQRVRAQIASLEAVLADVPEAAAADAAEPASGDAAAAGDEA